MHARLVIRVEVYELLLGRDDVLAPRLPRLEALGQPREVRAQALAAVAGEAARDVSIGDMPVRISKEEGKCAPCHDTTEGRVAYTDLLVHTTTPRPICRFRSWSPTFGQFAMIGDCVQPGAALAAPTRTRSSSWAAVVAK